MTARSSTRSRASRRDARQSPGWCTGRRSRRTPCSSAAAREPRSSRPRGSATCSSCADCAFRTCTTRSGASPTRSCRAGCGSSSSERITADGTVLAAARRGRGARSGRGAARVRHRVGRRLPPPLLPLSRARGGGRPDPARGASRHDRLALQRDPARAARVRAHRHHGGQRLRPPADGPLRGRHPPRPRRRRGRRAADDHAVLRGRDDRPRTRRCGRCSRSSRGPRPASSPPSGWRSGSGSRTRSPSTWAARPRRPR